MLIMTISRSERLRTTQEVYKQWVESGIEGGDIRCLKGNLSNNS
jgi:hypothetical protein